MYAKRRSDNRQIGSRVGGEPRTSVYNGCNGAKPARHAAYLFCDFRMGCALEMVYF
jgi:hypothetical protein